MRRVACAILLLMTLAAFSACVFGFLATFEPPGWPVLRVVYGVCGVAAIIASAWIVRMLAGSSRIK